LTGGIVTKDANATIVESNMALLCTEAIDAVDVAMNVIMFAFKQSHCFETMPRG